MQAILSTQLGDVGLPPDRVSFLIYCALVSEYAAGAYYPTEHFSTFIEAVAEVIDKAPGCGIVYNSEIQSVRMQGDRIAAVVTGDGREFRGRQFICNADPQWFASAVGRDHFPADFLARLDYRYSASSFTIYLGVRGLDLREYGFGNWNVWHYPHLDINRMYAAQNDRGDLSDPWIFMSTPTLYSPSSTTLHAPEGEQILELVTTCAYEPFRSRLDRDRKSYTKHKVAIRKRMIEIVEKHYVPRLRDHVVMRGGRFPNDQSPLSVGPQGQYLRLRAHPQPTSQPTD